MPASRPPLYSPTTLGDAANVRSLPPSSDTRPVLSPQQPVPRPRTSHISTRPCCSNTHTSLLAGAQFSNDNTRMACYQCVSKDVVSPSDCVTGAKNGSLVYNATAAALAPRDPRITGRFVCERQYAAIACTDSKSLIGSLVIKNITSELQACRVGSRTAPNPEPSNRPFHHRAHVLHPFRSLPSCLPTPQMFSSEGAAATQ